VPAAVGSEAASFERPYNRVVKIYTRTGDGGETSYFDGTRVRKDDPRLDTYGDIDELNAWLGLVRASAIDADLDAALTRIQQDLFALGAQLADPAGKLSARVLKAVVSDADVVRLESSIDGYERELAPLKKFILAGGTPAGAALHVARTVCRRAERRVIALEGEEIPPIVVIYLNRLSDLLFTLARVANRRAGAGEVTW